MKHASEQIARQIASLIKKCIEHEMLFTPTRNPVKEVSEISAIVRVSLSNMFNRVNFISSFLRDLRPSSIGCGSELSHIETIYGLYVFEKNLIKALANYSSGDLSISAIMDEYPMLVMPPTVLAVMPLSLRSMNGFNFEFQRDKILFTEVAVRGLLDIYREQIQAYRATQARSDNAQVAAETANAAMAAPVVNAAIGAGAAGPIVPAFAAARGTGNMLDTANGAASLLRPV